MLMFTLNLKLEIWAMFFFSHGAALVYSSHSNHKKVKIKIAQRLQREIKLRKAAEKNSADAQTTDNSNSVVKDLSKNSNKVVS